MRKNSENNREFDAVRGTAAERPAVGGAGRGRANFGHEALGRLVLSKAGHDKDTFLVIIGVDDEEHVLLADGRLRTIEKPKRKKLRHLAVQRAFSDELNKKLISGAPILDAELRKFIAEAAADAVEK
ncbi:MAG: KOW domain-containing RNA-binding protein [Clostridia bacterium]|nr:KOW domain-containing RNA-binding protein [Clostridia bacterium]